MKQKRIYIYAIYFPTSNKYYVGQTKNIKTRIPLHFYSGNLVCKALWKYDNWQISILHTCKTRDEANRIEIEEIRNFNSVTPNGYNLTHGGEGLFNPSEETKNKMKARMKGNKYRVGCKHTKETKEKMSASHQGNQNAKGLKHTEQAKKKIGRAVSKRNTGNKYNLGKKLSEKTKRKISESHLGKKHSKQTKIKMSISQLKNSLIKLEKEINADQY